MANLKLKCAAQTYGHTRAVFAVRGEGLSVPKTVAA